MNWKQARWMRMNQKLRFKKIRLHIELLLLFFNKLLGNNTQPRLVAKQTMTIIPYIVFHELTDLFHFIISKWCIRLHFLLMSTRQFTTHIYHSYNKLTRINATTSFCLVHTLFYQFNSSSHSWWLHLSSREIRYNFLSFTKCVMRVWIS